MPQNAANPTRGACGARQIDRLGRLINSNLSANTVHPARVAIVADGLVLAIVGNRAAARTYLREARL
jgi:hypothetical protein